MNFTLAAGLADKLGQTVRIVYVKVTSRGLQVQIGDDTSTAALADLLSQAGATDITTETSEPHPQYGGGWTRNVYAYGTVDGERVEVYGGEPVDAPVVPAQLEVDDALCSL